jgi:hypothetical protein
MMDFKKLEDMHKNIFSLNLKGEFPYNLCNKESYEAEFPIFKMESLKPQTEAEVLQISLKVIK